MDSGKQILTIQTSRCSMKNISIFRMDRNCTGCYRIERIIVKELEN